MTEAARQQALVAALFGADLDDAVGCAEHGERLRRGLAAYRSNGGAIAERALAARHPCLAALIGDEALAALARSLWRADPPRRGDLAHWGEALAEAIEARPDFAEWPYLGDVVRLESAMTRCEAAADAEPEPATLALLVEHASDALRLRLLPCVEIMASRWPLARIHAAHAPGAHADSFERARIALALGEGDALVVARSGWRAQVERIDEAAFGWMAAVARGASLAEARAAAGPDFDLSAWLARALSARWLWRAEPLPSRSTT